MLAGAVRSTAGAPLECAAVLVIDSVGKQLARTRSGADGSFGISGVPEGRYVVVASGELHDPAAATATLRADRVARLRFSLTPQHLVARETTRLRGGMPTTLDLALVSATSEASGPASPRTNGHRADGGCPPSDVHGQLLVPGAQQEQAEAGHRAQR
jgi:hypothetical protein